MSDEAALPVLRDLAVRLQRGHRSPAEVAAEARQGVEGALPAPAVIEQLRVEAEAQVVHSPRAGWALARVAYAAAQNLEGELLEVACTLTLAVTLNALGRFAEAMELFPTLAERFLAHDRPDHAGRCYSETAVACAHLGQFEEAQTVLGRARDLLTRVDDFLTQAHYDRAEGLYHQEQGRYAEAATCFHRAGDAFAAAGREDKVALAWCDRAYVERYVDPQQALRWLDKARRAPVLRDSTVHAARCDHVQALVCEELNRYTESLALSREAQTVFAAEGLDFLAAVCDSCQGVVLYRLNQYAEAQQALSRARTSFAAQGLGSHVTMCDLNIAVILYATNRYAEALAHYERVVDATLAEGRVLRVARCYTNMGLCYDRLGRYDRALVLHDRARQIFLEAGDPTYTALCQENLAGTYRKLGHHEQALEHYQAAREVFAEQALHIYAARCDTHMADLYLTWGQFEAALDCLEQARTTCQHEDMAVHVAACDREAARILTRAGEVDAAGSRLAQARTIFTEKGLLVDAALCDLAEGEVHLQQRDTAGALQAFTDALPLLDPNFPDEAWRAHYGLGRCALLRGARSRALARWLSAVELANRVRAALPAERLSGGFFSSRDQLYHDALKLALDLNATEEALIVTEASKSQTVLGLRSSRASDGRPGPGWRDTRRDDPYLIDLLDQEENLRQEMASLRRKLRLLEADAAGPILRNAGDLHRDQPQALARLTELARAYEEIVERLRLIAPDWLEAHLGELFSVSALRQTAAGRLPPRWMCLSYYVLDDTIITFFLDAQRIKVHSRPLTAYDRLVLRQCTAPARDFRELIYRGVIRGHRTPSAPGRTYLQHLYELLIPPEARELIEEDSSAGLEQRLLIVAPHGALHGLAFQALLDTDGRPLVSRVPLTYAPTLSALQLLLGAPASSHALDRVLACGLSDFGSRANPLPHAEHEVAALREVLGEQLHVLWGAEATRDAWLTLNESGDLAGYDTIHFASHAVLDPLAPSQSRVLLADGSLAIADILNLGLEGQLVVLSACEGAMGQPYPGDEIMGLARAFFLAGARTVVASLWPVEDASVAELMAGFYRRLSTSAGVVQALQAVQVEMADAGYVPYQWAPFITIGLP